MTMPEIESVSATPASPARRGAGEDRSIRTFTAQFSQATIDDLRQRINATKWPERETVTDSSEGVQLATTQSLARYWATDYDWRRCEAKLNAVPVVIGVHAPEFSFEKNSNNVRSAVKDMRVDYSVAVDNDHLIWRAFRNNYWPALYFVDAQGRVRHHYFGEGASEQSEMIIQELLGEAGKSGIDRQPVSVDARGLEAAADWGNLRSDENYVGYERTQNFASPGGAVLDKARMYELPARLRLNEWALSGDWTVKKEATALNEAKGRIAYRFHARDLHLVMGPKTPGAPVRFRVLIDGQPPGAAHGSDVDERGNGTVTQQRLYQLIRQQKPTEDRQFEIEFLDPDVEVFAFTFG
jgi:hypothetical protein